MKKRDVVLLIVGIVPIALGCMSNTAIVDGYSFVWSFSMICSPWIWLLACIFAADRKGKILKQSLMLFAVGIVMIVVYICYRAFFMESLGINSPLNLLPQYYLSPCVLLAARIYGLFEPEVWTSEPMLGISALLTFVITFAGVFIKTRFKNAERDF